MDTDSEDDLVLASMIGNGVESSNPPMRRPNLVTPVEEPIIPSLESINYELLVRGSSLVTMDERNLVPDYIFLAIAQLTRCRLANDDRVGSFKHYDVGCVGLCCRHCQGSRPGAGNGKFFPNSQRSLAQTTTTQSIVKHLTEKCGHVPRSIKVSSKLHLSPGKYLYTAFLTSTPRIVLYYLNARRIRSLVSQNNRKK